MCFKLLWGDTVHVFNRIDLAHSYRQRLYLSKYRCEDAFEIRSLRSHSEVNWVVWDHILLAVCMHACPGSHWRTTYLAKVLCGTTRRSHNNGKNGSTVRFNLRQNPQTPLRIAWFKGLLSMEKLKTLCKTLQWQFQNESCPLVNSALN